MPGLFNYYENVLGLDLADIKYVDADIAKLDLGEIKYQLAFGDAVIEIAATGSLFRYKIVGGSFHGRVGTTKKKIPTRATPILRFSMIDVQQADGMVLETPQGELITIDGGDTVLFARHLAARYSGTSEAHPLEVDAMIITHGDADHFRGLKEIVESEKETDPRRLRKRLFLHPARVLHNGLIKGPSSLSQADRFGEKKTGADGEKYVTELEENIFEVPDGRMNKDFRDWRDALVHWNDRRRRHSLPDIVFTRVDQTSDVFEQFETADMKYALYGPIIGEVDGAPALELLKKPKKQVDLHLEDDAATTGSISASHTINGHSIAFKIKYKNVRISLTGDLNQQAMAKIDAALPGFDFKAEVLKAPHHGSDDFDMEMLRKTEPVVSMISSGDENAFHEHIHPRATLVSALGKVSRGDNGVIFMTELAAFFRYRGLVEDQKVSPGDNKFFHGFERTNFGIIHIRTDGKRLLAFTHSGKKGMNEAYRFEVENNGVATSEKLKTVS
ncbi:MAG: MBL fold metallo-hydrolase [Rhizobiaceae bacterium]|nr:MBL fold metallo-hydrolase [Rhizobiaceae bacterium]